MKIFLAYAIEVIIGFCILVFSEDIKWFLFYSFCFLLFVIVRLGEYLRKMIRVFQVMNEIKLIAIVRKLNISNEEAQKVADEVRQKTGEEKWRVIEKEFVELTSY